jgi:predicted RNA binding protein YcfA (HicA-like mRNA interferase family)
MAEYEKTVRKILSDNGYSFARRGKGDHDIWYNRERNHHVAVDSKIKSRHTANAILKECLINFRF